MSHAQFYQNRENFGSESDPWVEPYEGEAATRLTVLQSIGPALNKRITVNRDGSWKKTGYQKAKQFIRHLSPPIANIHELSEYLPEIIRDPHRCIVLGKPCGDIPLEQPAQRLCHERPDGNKPTLEAQPIRILPVDLDGIIDPDCDPLDDPEGTAERAALKLGPEFEDVTFFYQFTASQKPTGNEARLRLWFVIAESYSLEGVKRWATELKDGIRNGEGWERVPIPIDPAIYAPAQPIFTAAPTFTNSHDPIPRRYGLVERERDTVALGIPEVQEGFRVSGQVTADYADVAAALEVIPNENRPDNRSWDYFSRIGGSCYQATEGKGFELFNGWSAKNAAVHDPAEVRERWEHWARYPMTQLGAGTLFYEARQACPGWEPPSRRPPPLEDGYYDSLTDERQVPPSAGGEGKEQESLEEIVKRLAKLSPLEYDKVRESNAEQMGVRLSTLDDEVKKVRKLAESATNGKMDIQDPEPWSDPVNGPALLDVIAQTIARYCVLPKGGAEAAALWVLMTYCLDHLFIAPNLCLGSPLKRCGKTTLLNVLAVLVKKPMVAASITPAALFRAVEKWQPTLLIDEADTFVKDNDELRGIINSGHTRNSAYAIRTVGDDHEPTQFSTWCAKVIAGIGNLPDTIADRSIVLTLRRKLKGETTERLRLDQLDTHKHIQQKCLRWVKDNVNAIRHKDPELPAGLNDRAADNWRSLFMIAETVGGYWPERAQKAVYTLVDMDAEDGSINAELLRDIREVFQSKSATKLPTKILLEALTADDEAPWATWNKGKPMSPRQLASRLREFGIHSNNIRVSENYTPKGYELEKFKDAFARYIPLSNATTPQTSNDAISGDFSNATKGGEWRNEKRHESSNGGTCGVVADKNPPSKGETYSGHEDMEDNPL